MVRPRSLKSLLTVITGAIAALALVMAVSLIWVTSVMHRSAATAMAAVESVHLVEEAEVELLLHARTTDHLVARDFETALRDKLARARAYVRGPDEARALEEATARVDAYLVAYLERPPGEPPAPGLAALQSSAYAALEAVVTTNLEQARREHADAERWNRLADIAGFVIAGALAAVATLVIVWLRRRAFYPVLGLAQAMRRFGAGDRAARAEETGLVELRDMSATFNEMANALVAQREAQLAMLAGVAHDLRQPLAVLAMSTTMLDPDAMSAAQMHRSIEISRRQIGQLERMIRDFLDMAKLDSGPLELQLQREDVCELIRGAAELQGGPATRDRIVLRLPAEPVHVRCDALRVQQVIANLLSNALKYSPADAPVDVVVEPRGGEVALRVTDRGPGLSADDQARLFEPFRRVGPAARAAPGIGLGLFVVRHILAAHGGRIEVESERGRGASFTAYLPLE